MWEKITPMVCAQVAFDDDDELPSSRESVSATGLCKCQVSSGSVQNNAKSVQK